MIRVLVAVVTLFCASAPAHAGFIYEWLGTVTLARSTGIDLNSKVTTLDSPTGGAIDVRLFLDDTYVPGKSFESSQVEQALVTIPTDSWSFFPNRDTPPGVMPVRSGPGSAIVDAGIGSVNIDGSRLELVWEQACLSDVRPNFSECFGLGVNGTGGPWELVSPLPIPEPVTLALCLLALAFAGVRRRRSD